MRSELCPSTGEYLVSLRARFRFDPATQILAKEILMRELVVATDEARIVPLKTVVSTLKMAADKLRRGHVHPRDATVIGIPAEVAECLEVVLARTNRTQRDLLEDHRIEVNVKQEVEATRAALARIQPLAERARNKQLCAEEFVAALRSEDDFNTARDQYLMLDAPRMTVFDEAGPVVAPQAIPLPRAFQSRSIHKVTGKITTLDTDSNVVRIKVISAEADSPFFVGEELGIRSISTRVPDEGDFQRIGFCVAFRLEPQLDLSIAVSVSASGLTYSASLVRFSDPQKLCQQLADAMQNRPTDLFESPNAAQACG